MLDFSVKTTGTSGSGDHRWCRTKDPSDWTIPVTIARTLLTAGTHYDQNGVVPSGLALGKATSGPSAGLWGPWDPAASDGRQVLAGFLLDPKQLSADFTGVTTTNFGAEMLVTGLIETAYLPGTPTLDLNTATTGQFVFIDVDYVAPPTPPQGA